MLGQNLVFSVMTSELFSFWDHQLVGAVPLPCFRTSPLRQRVSLLHEYCPLMRTQAPYLHCAVPPCINRHQPNLNSDIWSMDVNNARFKDAVSKNGLHFVSGVMFWVWSIVICKGWLSGLYRLHFFLETVPLLLSCEQLEYCVLSFDNRNSGMWYSCLQISLISLFVSKFSLSSLNIHNLGTHFAHTQLEQIWLNGTFTHCCTTISIYWPKKLPDIHF